MGEAGREMEQILIQECNLQARWKRNSLKELSQATLDGMHFLRPGALASSGQQDAVYLGSC